jgi:pyruvate formate lyase activating enzyme
VSRTPLVFRGLQKTTLIDYPDKIASTLFLDNCNFRCPFCQNPTLVLRQEQTTITEQQIIEFLKQRKKFLDGVCITGGEPTMHVELPAFAKRVKELGLLVKLDTNGSNPDMLKQMIDEGLVDYVAMDIKAPIERYDYVAKVTVNKEAILESVRIIRRSAPAYEFRTTVVPTLLREQDLLAIGRWLRGSKFYAIQQFQNDIPLLDPEFQQVKPYSREELLKFAELLKPYFQRIEVRGV